MLGKILLLENDIDMESIVTIILNDEGFLVGHTNFKSILVDVVGFKPDLVILSPRLRTHTEISKLCKDVRSARSVLLLPIIFLSARLDLELFTHQCDATAYVEKPFEVNDFCNTVKDILSL